ncbi:uncharacterized protein ANIA_11438 [Aspergillus nidulans FGSC A4]|uniref:Uncharacterized protein n=1 Tax=Emericella nidulans (strain FGSC A4 / ATCC 38163 / CBS 112.46 / NRRL 194 / M139) TaxID=227321 RepID=C8V8Q2_EMENI|nr:hypothetical protein [Aspergillus nidulans FGSC A4]CBF77526.1 TPA: hypothetical protein ANIA_11438 [Aspergillus nidulans FGSC A4]
MRRRCVRRCVSDIGTGTKPVGVFRAVEEPRVDHKTDDAGKATKYAGWHCNWQRQVGMGLSGTQLGTEGTEGTEMIAFLTRVAIPLASEVKKSK